MQLTSLFLGVTRPSPFTLDKAIASLFAAGEQGAWYDPSANNTTWRRNRLQRTEDLANSYWSRGNVVLTAGAAVSPIGDLAAYSIAPNSNSGTHYIITASGESPNFVGTITFSVYVKANGLKKIAFRESSATGAYAAFDLSVPSVLETGTAGAITAVTAPTPQAVGNGWYRISASMTSTSGATQGFGLWILPDNYTTGQPSSVSFSGNSTDGFYIWGPQTEQYQTSPTTYQPIITPEITYLSTVQAQPLLFQNAEGTLPVTEVEQPVGLMLDRRKGLALGSELNDGLASASNWVAYGSNTVSESNGEITVTYVTTEAGAKAELNAAAGLSSNLVVGAWYKITGEAKINTGSALVRVLTSITWDSATISSTTFVPWTIYFVATSTTANEIRFGGLSTGEAITLRNISVKLLDGNHAYQTTSSARPHLRSRYNLLTYSEQFDNAAWVKQGYVMTANTVVAPDGTTTAETAADNTTSTFHWFRQDITVTAGSTYTFSAYLKYNDQRYVGLAFFSTAVNNVDRVLLLDMTQTDPAQMVVQKDAGVTSNIQSVGNGWYRVSMTFTMLSAGTLWYLIVSSNTNSYPVSYAGTGKSVYVWGAQLNLGSTAMSYQRIAAAPTLSQPPTYATTSTMGGEVFRPYLFFDGADLMKTASIDISSTNKATCWVGVMSYTTASGTFLSHGPNLETTDGTFEVRRTSGSPGPYTILARGNLFYGGFNTAAKTAYSKDVISVRYDLSATPNSNAVIPRINGVLAQTEGTGGTLGSSNWTAQEFAIGARSGGTLYHNGDWYGCIFRAAASSLAEVETGERWVASKAGVTL